MTPLCLLLCDDLLDGSRISGHGRAAGVMVVQCRDSAQFLSALDRAPALIMIELHNPGLDVSGLVQAARSRGVARIIGYGSHVDASRLRSARQAGCDLVLPRSSFFEELDDLFTAAK